MTLFLLLWASTMGFVLLDPRRRARFFPKLPPRMRPSGTASWLVFGLVTYAMPAAILLVCVAMSLAELGVIPSAWVSTKLMFPFIAFSLLLIGVLYALRPVEVTAWTVRQHPELADAPWTATLGRFLGIGMAALAAALLATWFVAP